MKEIIKKLVIDLLTFEAKVVLRRTKPKIIAITGSVGKTSTKDAVYTVLKNHVHARKSEKNNNSDVGVALTVLGLRTAGNNPLLWIKNIFDGALHALVIHEYPKVLVLEMGVDRPGDMTRLTSWIKPDVAVITRLPDVPAHVEYFSSPQQVAEEKMILAYALKSDGVFIYNNDDEKIRNHLEDIRQQSFGFSRYSPSHFTASGDHVTYDGSVPTGMEFTLTHIKEKHAVKVHRSIGVQHAYTFAAAAAVGSVFDISLEQAIAELEGHAVPSGRMRIIEGVEGSVLLDDTYNSSPIACEHAIQTLAELRVQGRKVAILGDMLELGRFSVQEHERVGQFIANKVDILITIGVRAQKIAQTALTYGLDEEKIFQYEDADRAKVEIKRLVKTGDVILVKASQSIRAEKIVAFLMAKPEEAPALLARQDKMWSEQ